MPPKSLPLPSGLTLMVSPLMVLSKVNKQLVSDPPAGCPFCIAVEQSLTYRSGQGTVLPASTRHLIGLLIYWIVNIFGGNVWPLNCGANHRHLPTSNACNLPTFLAVASLSFLKPKQLYVCIFHLFIWQLVQLLSTLIFMRVSDVQYLSEKFWWTLNFGFLSPQLVPWAPVLPNAYTK